MACRNLSRMGGRQFLEVLLIQVVATCGSMERLLDHMKLKTMSVLRHAIVCDARFCTLWLTEHIETTGRMNVYSIGQLPIRSFLGGELDPTEEVNTVHYAAYLVRSLQLSRRLPYLHNSFGHRWPYCSFIQHCSWEVPCSYSKLIGPSPPCAHDQS